MMNSAEDIRKPAVAGLFYPDSPIDLKVTVNDYLKFVREKKEFSEISMDSSDDLFALIAPHAGYLYSGITAAYSYSMIRQKKYDTVVLIGPSHYSHFEGFALSYFKAFETPFGKVPLDLELINKFYKKGNKIYDFYNAAHIREHSLEVQLPFLQTVLDDFKIVPILISDQSYTNCVRGAKILTDVLSEYEGNILTVVSTDLSHYHQENKAEILDQRFIELTEKMNAKHLSEKLDTGDTEACGGGAVVMMLEAAERMKKNHFKLLYRSNSSEALKIQKEIERKNLNNLEKIKENEKKSGRSNPVHDLIEEPVVPKLANIPVPDKVVGYLSAAVW